MGQQFGHVPSAAACGNTTSTWYSTTKTPTQIFLCPDAHDNRDAMGAQINILPLPRIEGPTRERRSVLNASLRQWLEWISLGGALGAAPACDSPSSAALHADASSSRQDGRSRARSERHSIGGEAEACAPSTLQR
jgi:hypothetical protein